MKYYDYKVSGELVNANKIMDHGIFLPVHHNIMKAARNFVVDTISSFVNEKIP